MVNLIISKRGRIALAVLLLMIPFFFAFGQRVSATGFVVNTTLDGADANPGNGICEMIAGHGDCSLRAAIMEANAFSGADVITLPDGVYNLDNRNTTQGSFKGAELNIAESLTIMGTSTSRTIINMPTSSTVVGWATDRVMSFTASFGAFDVENLTIQNGNPPLTANGGSHGGGVYVDINAGSLSLKSVVVSANTASGDSQSSGGGVYVFSGNVTLDHSVLQGNSATYRGGGLMLVAGTVVLQDQTLVNGANTAQYGGGIFIQGDLSLNETTIENNNAVISGGGIATQGSSGSLLIQKSTIDKNQVTGGSGSGGGISTGLPTQLINVTIAGNTASDRAAIAGTSVSSSMTISSSTIVGNTASNTAAIGGTGSIVFTNSLVGGNTPANCSGPNLSSGGYNIEDGHTCGVALPTDTQNSATVLAKLGFLQYNGGKVWTMALLPGNPAINHGANGTSCPATDARGFIRPSGRSCDAGAFEYPLKILFLPLIFR
jgi:CSLREA domain-containing protein